MQIFRSGAAVDNLHTRASGNGHATVPPPAPEAFIGPNQVAQPALPRVAHRERSWYYLFFCQNLATVD